MNNVDSKLLIYVALHIFKNSREDFLLLTLKQVKETKVNKLLTF